MAKLLAGKIPDWAGRSSGYGSGDGYGEGSGDGSGDGYGDGWASATYYKIFTQTKD